MLEPEPAADVAEAATNSQRRRRQYYRLQLIEKCLPENVGHRDRRRLQKHVLLSSATSASFTSAFDPEHGVLLIGLHHEAELHPQLLHPAAEIVYLFWLLGHRLQLDVKVHQGVLQADVLVAVFFQE